MLQYLNDIRNGTSWSFADLIYGLDDLKDTDGRPLGERRASSRVKAGVTLELRHCPYRDGRHGQPMNVSALEQVVAHYRDVMCHLQALQRTLPSGWAAFERMLCGVVDLLSGPAVHALTAKSTDMVLPVPTAVGYKLAAGYFSVVRDFQTYAATADALCAQIATTLQQRELLFGASEVCAGPPHLIRKTTAALAFKPDSDGPRADAARVKRVVNLSAQLRIGAAWKVIDEAVEQFILFTPPADALRARTSFLDAELERRREALRARTSKPLSAAKQTLPQGLAPSISDKLEGALPAEMPASDHPWLGHLLAANREPEAALVLEDPSWVCVLVRLAELIACRQLFFGALHTLEQAIRAGLPGHQALAGFTPSTLILPSGRAMRWLEALLGMKLQIQAEGAEQPPSVVLRNHKRQVPLPPLD